MKLHVAGRGAINSLGASHATFLDGIFTGRSGIKPLERLAGTDCLTGVCGEVPVEFRGEVEDDVDLPRRLA